MVVVRAVRMLLCLLLIGPAVAVRAQPAPIEVQKLKPNLFLLTGGNGNTLVFVRSHDVVVINTKGPRPWWGARIAEHVKALTPLPITTLINTSSSGSFVGGNPYFADRKVEIIAHEYAAADMRKRDLAVHRDFMRDFLEAARRARKAGQTPEAAAKAWRTLHLNHAAPKTISPSCSRNTPLAWSSCAVQHRLPMCTSVPV
jgi:glyoxylase-like metal-dependent hydrolase (beta-lactamase superfamily II)